MKVNCDVCIKEKAIHHYFERAICHFAWLELAKMRNIDFITPRDLILNYLPRAMKYVSYDDILMSVETAFELKFECPLDGKFNVKSCLKALKNSELSQIPYARLIYLDHIGDVSRKEDYMDELELEYRRQNTQLFTDSYHEDLKKIQPYDDCWTCLRCEKDHDDERHLLKRKFEEKIVEKEKEKFSKKVFDGNFTLV